MVKYISISIVLILLTLLSRVAMAEDQAVTLEITPQQCVALHQGQSCHQDVEFTWRTPEIGSYCLFQSNHEAPLVCWEGQDIQQQEFYFIGLETTKYEIRENGSDTSLAEALITVAWVYKSKRKSDNTWRIF